MIDVRLPPNPPARTEPETLRSGPAPTGNTTPNSPASIDQSPPNVPANPKDNAWPASGADSTGSTSSMGAMIRRTGMVLSRVSAAMARTFSYQEPTAPFRVDPAGGPGRCHRDPRSDTRSCGPPRSLLVVQDA